MSDQIETFKHNSGLLLQNANDLVVSSYEEAMDAADILARVKEQAELLEAHRESITKPINDSLKKVRALFRPVEDAYATAEHNIKEKLLDYHHTTWDGGENTLNTIKGSIGKVTLSAKPRRVVIEDESKLPRQFLMPDMAKIEGALKVGFPVEGARYEDQGFTIRAGKA